MKRMKVWVIIVVAALALASFAAVYAQTDTEGVADSSTVATYGRHGAFVDGDGDGVCDNFVDENGDGVCDNCPHGGMQQQWQGRMGQMGGMSNRMGSWFGGMGGWFNGMGRWNASPDSSE